MEHNLFNKKELPKKWGTALVEQIAAKENISEINVEDYSDDKVIESFEGDSEDDSDVKKSISKVEDIDIKKLIPFKSHPFREYTEEKKNELIESIKINGIINPIIVRKIEDEKYEIIAGHNRTNACKELEYKTVPCIVKNLSDDEATLEMVESNLYYRGENNK